MKKITSCFIFIILLSASSFLSCSTQSSTQDSNLDKSYYFDENGISREVLENYLDRSITMASFLIKKDGETYPCNDDDIRLIKNIKPKFIGRAISRWGGEKTLNTSMFWSNAKELINLVHEFDPDIIFQAALFEIVSEEINSIKIPQWVFKGFGLTPESRSFSYKSMLNDDGNFVDHWSKGSSVPDISKIETQLWFYFLAGSYIDIGCEAFHLGQIELIGMNDPKRESWAYLIKTIRNYAKKNARRSWVLLDAHVPHGGMLKENVSLLDFNSFPMRVKAVPGAKMYEAKLEVNHLDAIYKKSKGCDITPSGWSCESLPYLVELDNYGHGQGDAPNVADTTSYFVWGWDEITWFSLLDEDSRNNWLEYAHNWLRNTDPNGHLQMPIKRGHYHANTKSNACPIGYSQEETIKRLWNEQ